jgi:hypothetical protein
MSRKDYELIARSLNRQRGMGPPGLGTDALVIDRVARDLAYEFRRDNARFNPEKFLQAAGVQ